MTDDRVALLELIEKGADCDLVRKLLAFASDRLMAAEIDQRTGAAAGVRSPDRINHRNGYRERGWETRVGRIDLAIPKLRARKGAALRPHPRDLRRRLQGRPDHASRLPGRGSAAPRLLPRWRRPTSGRLSNRH